MEKEFGEGSGSGSTDGGGTDGGSTWDSGTDGVTVGLPDGSTETFDSVSSADIKELARNSGVRKFHVKKSDGTAVQPNDFPMTSGKIKIEEYNEAKYLWIA